MQECKLNCLKHDFIFLCARFAGLLQLQQENLEV